MVGSVDGGGCCGGVLSGWTWGPTASGIMFFKDMEWESGELLFGEMVVSYGSLFGDFAVETRVTHTATHGTGKSLFSEFEYRNGTVNAERRDLACEMGKGCPDGFADLVIGEEDTGGEFGGLLMEGPTR